MGNYAVLGVLTLRSWGEIVAAYGQRFTCEEAYKDQQNDPGAGFHLNCFTLGTAKR